MASCREHGFVAHGRERVTTSEAFQLRKSAIRQAVRDDFVSRLVSADGLWEITRLHWQMYVQMRQALKKIYPSDASCFFVAEPRVR